MTNRFTPLSKEDEIMQSLKIARLGGCAAPLDRKTMTTRRTLLLAVPAVFLATAVRAAPVPVTLYKNPECGCCEGYADYLRSHGFTVTVKASTDLAEISRKAGIPPDLEGCHTAFIGNYVVDGHIPVEAIDKLLTDRPAIKGISLPGMPQGSPGMSGEKTGPFTIYAIGRDGKVSTYMTL
jgi:hypothetical protein